MKKIGLTLLKALAFFVVWGGGMSLPIFLELDNIAAQRLLWEFYPFAAVVLVNFLFVKVVEKNTIEISLWGNAVKNTLLSIALSIVWLGGSMAILTISGTMQFQASNEVAYLPLWFLAVLLNSAMQELLVRGYLYQLIKGKYNTVAALIITTALFTALHGGAFEGGFVPVLNVLTMSVFVTLLLEYTGTLLAPIIVHFLWNAIGCVVLGAVSLADDYPNIMNIYFSDNTILSGGIYRLEGSVVVLIINMLLIGFTAFLLHKKHSTK